MVKRFVFPVIVIVVAVIVLAMQLNGSWSKNELARAGGAALIFTVLAWLAIRTTRGTQHRQELSALLDGMRAHVNVPDTSGNFNDLRFAVVRALEDALRKRGARTTTSPNAPDANVIFEIGTMGQEVTIRPGRPGKRLAERRISVIVRLLKPGAMSGDARLVTIGISEMGVSDDSKAKLFAEAIVERIKVRCEPGGIPVIGWT